MIENELIILNFLGRNIEQEFTMNELSKRTSIPYATLFRTLKKMNLLVNARTVGKATVVILNTEYHLIKSYLTIASDKSKEEYLSKDPSLKKISDDIDTKDIVLFYDETFQMNKETNLIIINKEGKKSVNFSKNDRIKSIFLSEKEFLQKLRDKEENLVKQVMKKHVLLKNPEKFWGLVFQ